MRRLGTVLVLLALAGLVWATDAGAAQGRPRRGRPVFGKLTKIEGMVLTVAVPKEGGEPTEQTVTADEKTQVFMDAAVKVAGVLPAASVARFVIATCRLIVPDPPSPAPAATVTVAPPADSAPFTRSRPMLTAVAP